MYECDLRFNSALKLIFEIFYIYEKILSHISERMDSLRFLVKDEIEFIKMFLSSKQTFVLMKQLALFK